MTKTLAIIIGLCAGLGCDSPDWESNGQQGELYGTIGIDTDTQQTQLLISRYYMEYQDCDFHLIGHCIEGEERQYEALAGPLDVTIIPQTAANATTPDVGEYGHYSRAVYLDITDPGENFEILIKVDGLEDRWFVSELEPFQ